MKLNRLSPDPPGSINEEKCRVKADEMKREIGEYQAKLYAEARQSLLVIFQGMDASGKDGAIKNVFIDVNPMGCHVICFKEPTIHELKHDFLWRIHQQAPPYGMIHIFNRSHYEDILIPAVNGSIKNDRIKKRYEQINDFEMMLQENGTHILKFFLNVSKDEQETRLNERLENPVKFWKHKDSDWVSRERWDDYMEVYEKVLDRCDRIPWHVIPSNRNWYKEYLVAQTVLDKLRGMTPEFPALKTKMFSK